MHRPTAAAAPSSSAATRPPLDRQFDIVTAPLATFDTVDLSDDEPTARCVVKFPGGGFDAEQQHPSCRGDGSCSGFDFQPVVGSPASSDDQEEKQQQPEGESSRHSPEPPGAEILRDGVGARFASFDSGNDVGSDHSPTVAKPKEIKGEKANLLEDSTSSDADSDLTPTERNGGFEASGTGVVAAEKSTSQNWGARDAGSPEIEVITSESKRKAYERRLQRLQVKTTPINRPRSTTPINVVTLEEYISFSSPEVSPNLEKLKIVLPPDQFGRVLKSPRRSPRDIVKDSVFDFSEERLFSHTKAAIVLQSDGSIGNSPKRVLIPPSLSPSGSPCKSLSGSPAASKLVLLSKVSATNSPIWPEIESKLKRNWEKFSNTQQSKTPEESVVGKEICTKLDDLENFHTDSTTTTTTKNLEEEDDEILTVEIEPNDIGKGYSIEVKSQEKSIRNLEIYRHSYRKRSSSSSSSSSSESSQPPTPTCYVAVDSPKASS